MQIYLFGALLLVLLVVLVLIIRHTLRMIREREALLAVGPVKWQPWSPTEELDAGAAMRPDDAGGDAAGVTAAPGAAPAQARASEVVSADGAEQPLPVSPRSEPVPGRTSPARRRQLVSMSEHASPAAARQWPITPGYFKELEGRLEVAFEALCAGQIDLARYIELIDKEYETAQRLEINLGPLADDDLQSEANNAISALEWCKNWALEQLKPDRAPAAP